MIDIVERIDEKLSSVSWPEINVTDNKNPGEGDLVVLCGGFEERATAYLVELRRSGAVGYSVTIIDYLPKYPENRTANLRSVALETITSVETVVYDRGNPSGIADSFIENLSGSTNVFLDISAMSRLLIIQLITGFIRSKNVCRLQIVYAEAETYPPKRADVVTKLKQFKNVTSEGGFLSRGIMEIAAAPELSSIAMPGEAIRLIAFPSFDPVQLRSVIDELQPSYIHVLHGTPPRCELAWRHDMIREMNLPTFAGEKHLDEASVSTLDYRDTVDALLAIYQEHSTFDRIVVSPTGSKMQAVAVGLVRAVLPDIQIIYPTPHRFTSPDSHTMGLRQLYSLEVPLEGLRTL